MAAWPCFVAGLSIVLAWQQYDDRRPGRERPHASSRSRRSSTLVHRQIQTLSSSQAPSVVGQQPSADGVVLPPANLPGAALFTGGSIATASSGDERRGSEPRKPRQSHHFSGRRHSQAVRSAGLSAKPSASWSSSSRSTFGPRGAITGVPPGARSCGGGQQAGARARLRQPPAGRPERPASPRRPRARENTACSSASRDARARLGPFRRRRRRRRLPRRRYPAGSRRSTGRARRCLSRRGRFSWLGSVFAAVLLVLATRLRNAPGSSGG